MLNYKPMLDEKISLHLHCHMSMNGHTYTYINTSTWQNYDSEHDLFILISWLDMSILAARWISNFGVYLMTNIFPS